MFIEPECCSVDSSAIQTKTDELDHLLEMDRQELIDEVRRLRGIGEVYRTDYMAEELNCIAEFFRQCKRMHANPKHYVVAMNDSKMANFSRGMVYQVAAAMALLGLPTDADAETVMNLADETWFFAKFCDLPSKNEPYLDRAPLITLVADPVLEVLVGRAPSIWQRMDQIGLTLLDMLER